MYFLLKPGDTTSWLDDNCDQLPDGRSYCVYPQRVLDQKVADGQTASTVGTALAVAGGAAFAASTAWLIYLYVADDAPKAPKATLTPSVAPGYAGVSASFAF